MYLARKLKINKKEQKAAEIQYSQDSNHQPVSYYYYGGAVTTRWTAASKANIKLYSIKSIQFGEYSPSQSIQFISFQFRFPVQSSKQQQKGGQ